MRSDSGIGSEPVWAWLPAWVLVALALAGVLAALGCAKGGGSAGAGSSAAAAREEKTVLVAKKGETSIKVTESEVNGDQLVRISTLFRGEDNVILLDIDQPVYEIEIPLTLDQVIPQAASAQVRGPEGQFQDLLVAQYLQKAQEAMLAGDYNGALRQVDTVLQVQPNHVQAHTMKGSVYYALGNYELASEEWQYVLSLDPTNKEVQDFQSFLKNRSTGRPPKLPGSPPSSQAPRAPATGGSNPGGADGAGGSSPPDAANGGKQQ